MMIERMLPDEPDLPLLRKAVEWAEAEAAKPEAECQWYQGTWRWDGESLGRNCGTAYCIAGYVGQLIDERYQHENTVDGVHVSYAAAKALGIPAKVYDVDGETWAMHELFAGGNTIEDVRRSAEAIAENAGERL